MEIYHDGAVKIWPDYPFLAFTTISIFEPPDLLIISPYII